MQILGIDVGASGIKGAIVDIEKGEMVTERLRLETPQPATPERMAATLAQLVKDIGWENGPIGVGFPAIVKNNVALSAANIDDSWIGVNIADLFGEVTNCPVFALNDADAAGVASMQFGAAKEIKGTVLFITIGSGLGSALFYEGKLIPNTELGHFELKGMVAEHYASSNARKKFELGWGAWGKRFNQYLLVIERLFSPDLVLLGGGASKKMAKFEDKITTKMPVKAAELQNAAGIIGAACYAHKQAISSNKNNQ